MVPFGTFTPNLSTKMAESEGFEPSIPTRSITIFETVAFDHSASSPQKLHLIYTILGVFANFFLH